MQQTIDIGQIVKPQGVKGAVKVKPFTNDIKRFEKLKSVVIDSVTHKIEEVSFVGGFVVLKFENCASRNEAESFRNKFITVDKSFIPVPKEGEYFIADLIGLAVVDENNKELGKIVQINAFGSADVVECMGKNGAFRFPFLERIVKEVLLEKKQFCVFKKKLGEVIVYDD
ncbi:MAG: ribosome maturation factor RimM [Firmicutes bacterium]|nr:ribosome maturation factor RimM [Bacillota bacterium]